MSDQVVLTLRTPLQKPLAAACIAADQFAALGEREIAALPVRHDGRVAVLGDFFAVRGERSARVRIVGHVETAEGIGTHMAGGEVVVEGHVGRDLGLGMSGGEIVVRGSVGENVGTGMRRGVIVVMGDAARGTGQSVIAGTVVVFGQLAPGAGRFLKRGSIVGFGEIDRPATFRYACTYRPPYLRVLFTHLRRHYDLLIADAHVGGRYHRYSGDLAELGRGEILQWAGE